MLPSYVPTFVALLILICCGIILSSFLHRYIAYRVTSEATAEREARKRWDLFTVDAFALISLGFSLIFFCASVVVVHQGNTELLKSATETIAYTNETANRLFSEIAPLFILSISAIILSKCSFFCAIRERFNQKVQ